MDVTIEKLIYGGDALAHHEGATLFVPFVLPGEKAAVTPAEQSKKFMRCNLDAILEPSPQRVAAPCPHFGICGGCHYQHIPYPAQLQYKQEILRETLRRIGKIDYTAEIVTHSWEPYEYRNRAQWKVRNITDKRAAGAEPSNGAEPSRDDAAPPENSSPENTQPENNSPENRAPDDSAPEIGYFRANSNTLMPAYACPILAPELFATLTALRALLQDRTLPPSLREAEAFASSPDSILLTLSFSKFPSNRPALRNALFSRVPGLLSLLIQDAAQQRMELFGPGSLNYSLKYPVAHDAGDFQYRVSHLSFFQVNRFAIADMSRTVADLAGEGALALDLFCGVGLFSLPLAQKFDQVTGVESNPTAIRDFQFASALAAPRLRGKTQSREADATAFLRTFRNKPDCVVLDPPRAGLDRDAAQRLLKIQPRRIVYVSCDPATLARDLALLAPRYAISALHLFDLFPQTFHLESIASLTLRE